MWKNALASMESKQLKTYNLISPNNDNCMFHILLEIHIYEIDQVISTICKLKTVTKSKKNYPNWCETATFCVFFNVTRFCIPRNNKHFKLHKDCEKKT